MAAKKSAKCCYQSSYGGGWITAAARLAEIACERTAAKQGKELPTRFWMTSHGLKEFRAQQTHANRLLQTYPPVPIFRALESPEGKHVHSLGAPFFLEIVEREHQKALIESQRAIDTPLPEITDVHAKPRQPTPKQSIYSKLHAKDQTNH